MLNSFFLALGIVCVPGILSLFFASFRRSVWTSLPLMFLAQWLGTAVLACILRHQAFGWEKLFTLFLGASLFSFYVVSRVLKTGIRERNIHTKKRFIFLSLAALLLVADLWIIQGRQGWSFADGNLWPHKETFFRGPLNTDAQRNTNVIESLIRGGKSTPFLPESEFRFQLCWFHWAAAIVAPFHAITRYPYVQGVLLATATLFSFFLLWAIFWFKPRLVLKNAWVLLLLFLHADLFHFIGSIVINHVPGMEADGSFPWLFFRNFSTKLMSLVSGHHTMFFAALAVYLVLPRVVASRRLRFFVEGLLFQGLVLISAVFSAFFFVFYLPVQGWVEYKRGRDVWAFAFRYGLFSFLAFFTHWAVIGFKPSDLFFRQMKSDLHWFPAFSREALLGWLQLPFLPIAVSGVLGVLLMGLALHAYATKRKNPRLWPLISVYFGGNFFCYYVLSGTEFQRHFAILSAFVGSILLVQWLPRSLFLKHRWCLRQSLGVAFALHLYFVLCFTVKPNAVDTTIAWKDYFELNQKLREKYAERAVVSPLAHLNGGFPITMEATTSFSLPVDVFIHSQVDKQKLDLLMKASAARSVVPYAKALGYEFITWGPLEDKRWGDKVKKRFIHEKNRVEQVGQAGLYRIEDRLLARYPAENLKTAEDFALLGDELNRDEWEQEAFEAYQTAVSMDPKLARCWNNLGELLVRGGLAEVSVDYFQKALELEPESAIGHYNLGTAYALMRKDGLALREFLAAENRDVTFFKAKEMVSRALVELGRKDLAELARKK